MKRAAAIAATTLAILSTLVAVPASAASAASSASTVSLPGGRSTFVISMMSGRINALAVRLATYSFSTDGTVTERYWAWRQDSISGKGNVSWTKPRSGYITSGCLRACPVRTPVGFQSGVPARSWKGTWSVEAANVLVVHWGVGNPDERWRLDTSRAGVVGAKLLSGGTNAEGWGVGSNARPDRGVSLSSVYRDGGWVTGPFSENAYTSTTRHLSVGLRPADYSLCGTGRCMQGRNVTGPDRRGWYHSYLAANSAVDGRKVYWNNQTGVVQQLEGAGTVCISASGGGHTNALLQALDDNGKFVGFVGVEASLNQRKYGQDIVAAYAMVRPSLLPTIQ